jgi:hypothetical protein
MKNWFKIFCLILSFQSWGQETNNELEFHVIKETLPQVLDANPNSIASYLKGGGWYETLFPIIVESADSNQLKSELDLVSDSITKILEHSKICVLLSDTLFAYKYSPFYYDHGDGWVDTFDLRNSSDWLIEYEDLVEVFQTNHKYRGLSKPIDLDFTELVRAHICSNPSQDIPIDLNKLNSLNYTFTSVLPANHDSLRNQGLLMRGIRVYKPVFNKSQDKACYLFSFQARNGPWREFVFIEKKNGKWHFLDTYGSEHIDRNENWFK